ncbi:MAG: S8 family serine peptidase [Clostridiales bacterium]|nr:S8 family serine peptidase [Clostridiales bacterium]
MKKTRNVILLTLTLVLVFACFASVAFVSRQRVAFVDFAADIRQLISEYDADGYQEISFDLDSLTKVNNTYMVNSDVYVNVVGASMLQDNVDSYTIRNDETTVQFNLEDYRLRVDDEIFITNTPAQIVGGDLVLPIEVISRSLGYDLKFSDEQLLLTRPYATKRIIVSSKADVDSCGAIASVEGQNLHIFQYATEKATKQACKYFDTLQGIDGYKVDSVFTVQDMDDVRVAGVGDSYSYTSWGAEAMDVESYSQYLVNTVGTLNLPEVVVAVLDTGIDTDHPWFDGRIADGGVNYSSSSSATQYEYEDGHGHGTHVSGIICDLTLSNVKILPIKVFNNQGKSSGLALILGINYARQLKMDGLNICAINMSLTSSGVEVGSEEFNYFYTALKGAYDEGILSVVASGNDSVDVSDISPANVDVAITVGAVEQVGISYEYAPYSNYGEYVDICAPGSYITSAWVGSGTNTKSGTSMATPHVSAAVALLASDVSKGYNIAQLEETLYANAIDLGDEGWDRYYGVGMVNLCYAYAELLPSVTFSNTASDCLAPFSLSLSCSEAPNATVVYTLDGTEPSLINGQVYSSPILIDKTQIVKAKAFVLSSGQVQQCSKTSQMVYSFNGDYVEGIYIVDPNGVLTAYRGSKTDVVVPEKVNGVTVIAIGEGAFAYSDMTSITLPSTVTLIQQYAFTGCGNLRQIYAPGVTSVEYSAFSQCVSLQSLTDENFPNLQIIGSYAFYQCVSLQSVSLSAVYTIQARAFDMEDVESARLTDVNLPNVSQIGELAFAECVNLSNINIPKVWLIESNVFQGCNSLKSLYLPGIVTIFSNSFVGSYLDRLIIGKSLSQNSIDFTIDSSVTIYGYANSTAQAYADSNGNPFVAIDEFVLQQNLPSFIEATVGDAINLSVKVDGFELKYEWYATHGSTVDGTVIDGETSPILTIDTSEQGTFKYYVVVTNWDGQVIVSDICTVKVIKIFTITATAGDNGTISSEGSNSVVGGDTVIYTFEPSTGYHVSQIYVDNFPLNEEEKEYAIANGYKFLNVNADHSIYVTFEINVYTVTVTQASNGSISPSGEINANYGSQVTLTVTANKGYFIVKLIVDGRQITDGDLTSYTFYDITSNHTFSAEFEEVGVTYTVKHWQESLSQEGATYYDGKYYTLSNEQALMGKTGNLTNAEANQYDGFSALAIEQQRISAYGDTVVNVYYVRNLYQLKSVTTEGIARIDGEGYYLYGETVTVTAVMQQGYNFAYWISSVSTVTLLNDVSCTFTMPSSELTLTAYATVKKFTITVVQTLNGSISPCDEVQANYGSQIALTISANAGYAIAKLIVDGIEITDGDLTSYTFYEVTDDHTFSAKFEAVGTTYTVNHWQESLTQEGATLVEGKYYTLCQSETLVGETDEQTNAQANEYEGFTAQAFEQLTISYDGKTVVNIYYTRNSYEVKLVKTNGIYSVSGEGSYKYGSSVIVSATAEQGYVFTKWTSSYDGLEYLNISSITFTMPSCEITLTAYADVRLLSITVTQSEHGSISPAGETIVRYGSQVSITITADKGYTIAKLIIDGSDVVTENMSTYKFSRVTDNHTFTAVFVALNLNYTVNHWQESLTQEGATLVDGRYYTLYETQNLQGKTDSKTEAKANTYAGFTNLKIKQVKIDASGNTSVDIYYTRQSYVLTLIMTDGISSVNGAGTYLYGSEVTVTVTIDVGYNFAYWKSSVDGIYNLDKESMTITMPSSDLTLTAFAKIKTFTITIVQSAHGTIQAEKLVVNYMEDVLITFTPDEGYYLWVIVIDGRVVNGSQTYILTAVQRDHTITATFSENTTYNPTPSIPSEKEPPTDNGNKVGEFILRNLWIFVLIIIALALTAAIVLVCKYKKK